MIRGRQGHTILEKYPVIIAPAFAATTLQEVDFNVIWKPITRKPIFVGNHGMSQSVGLAGTVEQMSSTMKIPSADFSYLPLSVPVCND